MTDSPLSRVNVVLVMAYGSLVSDVHPLNVSVSHIQVTCVRLCTQVFVLLFIFVKRQIMRFAMRSRRGPHAPIGHNAPKVSAVIFSPEGGDVYRETSVKVSVSQFFIHVQGLREEIDSRLSKVHEIHFEPRLLSEEDDRLKPGHISQWLSLSFFSV